jgi:hypothetical protein
MTELVDLGAAAFSLRNARDTHYNESRYTPEFDTALDTLEALIAEAHTARLAISARSEAPDLESLVNTVVDAAGRLAETIVERTTTEVMNAAGAFGVNYEKKLKEIDQLQDECRALCSRIDLLEFSRGEQRAEIVKRGETIDTLRVELENTTALLTAARAQFVPDQRTLDGGSVRTELGRPIRDNPQA